MALLAGEPGIGKTRLAVELAGAALESGGVVLAGRCDEDLGVPYQPFVEALRHYATHAAIPRLGRHGGELTRLIPELAKRVAGLPEPLRSDPETERYRLFDAVAAWLADASVEAPVLLVLDDVQWAAKPTLLLLRHVLRAAEPLGLLVVATYRDTDIGRGDPLTEFLADLRREGVGERFQLTGLDRAGVGAFIEAAAGHSLADDEGEEFVRAVWEETEGNPFFVAEVLRHLTESGGVERRDGRWVTTVPVEQLGIPEGVRDVVGRRLSRLPDGTDRILGVAAVVGLEFEPAVVAAAGGCSDDELFSALEAAATARLVSEVPGGARYRFSHTLVRATLYDEISGPRRVALHRKVAEAIETIHGRHLDDYLPALAHHWARASTLAADADRAVEYATRAGDRALAQLAHDEAAAYYSQALELLVAARAPTDNARRQELLIALGEAQRRAGDPAHRETLLSAAHLAQERGDADALARAALANYRGLFSLVERVDGERVAVLEAALESSGSSDESPMRARLLATLAAELTYSPEHERRHALWSQALAVARRAGDRYALGYVLAHQSAVWGPTNVEERFHNATELAALAAEFADPTLEFWAAVWHLFIGTERGDMAAVDDGLGAMIRLAGELGQPTLHWMATCFEVSPLLLAGRIAEAETVARQAFELGQVAGAPDAFRCYGTQLFWIRFDQGRLTEVMETVERAAGRPGASRLTRAALAWALCELDRLDEARPLVLELAAGAFADAPFHYMSLLGLTMVAGACAALGDVAGTLYDQLKPHHAVIPTSGLVTFGSVEYYLGLLAATLTRLDDAAGHFAAAAAVHERIGAPTWLARTRLEWGRMLLSHREAGNAERARELLGQASATARELGLVNVERRAVELLASHNRSAYEPRGHNRDRLRSRPRPTTT